MSEPRIISTTRDRVGESPVWDVAAQALCWVDFVDMAPLPGRPGGAAIDAQGHYWICGNDAGKVQRFDPSGRLVASQDVPVPKPSMCAFGGSQLDVLFVTSIQPAGTVSASDGALFALDAGVRGLPEPSFSRFPPSCR